jgi:hypothetical protein
MSHHPSSPERSEINPSAILEANQINELGQFVFQIIEYCTSEQVLPNLDLLANETGVPLNQVMGESIATIILRHYHVSRRDESIAFGA